MLKHYARTAAGYLLKNKLFNLINVGGLTVGLAACLLIGLYVQNETSYDRHWQNSDAIYRISQRVVFQGEVEETAPTSLKLLPALQQYFPDQIAEGTRIAWMSGETRVDEASYVERVNLVDRTFPEVFQLQVLAGEIANVFSNTSTIALSRNAARRYFGAESPIGRIVTFRPANAEPVEYRVGAVYELRAGNTTLVLDNFVLLDYSRFEDDESWLAVSGETYVELRPGVDRMQFEAQLPEFVDRRVSIPPEVLPDGQSPRDVLRYFAQRIDEIYFNPAANPNFPSSISGDERMVAVFSMISILVLLVGLANFVILSTAKSTQRAREVGVRKAAGAGRSQIVLQFLGESLLLTSLALALAVTVVELLLPAFAILTGKQLTIPYDSPSIWAALAGLLLFVGVVGGIYPACVLADFKAANTSGTLRLLRKQAGSGLRNSLIVFQFSISIGLIIATAVVYGQLLYLDRIEPGFNSNNLLVVENMNSRAINPLKNVFREEILQLPGITSAAYSSNEPDNVGNGGVDVGLYRPRGSTAPGFGITTLSVGTDFFQTYEIPLRSGRSFADGRDPELRRPFLLTPEERERYAAQENHVMLNEAATLAFGFESAEAAADQYIQIASADGEFRDALVIGVVADSRFIDLRSRPVPEVYQFFPEIARFLTIRYDGEREDTLGDVEAIWKRHMGDAVFTFSFVDQNLRGAFAKERNEARILSTFALLAIVIACLGLFGSAAFTVACRTKEIGIRKVMGADVMQVVQLLLWQFSRPVMLANLIAWPIAIQAMTQWLQRFPYQIELWMLAPICVVSGLTALCIAWATVGSAAAKVAVQKPVLALRYE